MYSLRRVAASALRHSPSQQHLFLASRRPPLHRLSGSPTSNPVATAATATAAATAADANALTTKGLELLDSDQAAEALACLQAAVAWGKDFDGVADAFFGLGMLARNDMQALREEDEDEVDEASGGMEIAGGTSALPDGGASSQKEVIAQIKAERKKAAKERRRRLKAARAANATDANNAGGVASESAATSGGETTESLVPPEEKLAATFFELAASKGHSGAMVALGNICLLTAEVPPEDDETKPVEMESVGETKVDVDATGEDTGAGARSSDRLVISHVRPVPTAAVDAAALQQRTAARAVEWYEAAAAATPPHPDALFNLGQIYYAGRGGLERDPTRALAYFEAAAASGDQAAQFWLGTMLRAGDAEDGIVADPRAAVAHLEAAAGLGAGATRAGSSGGVGGGGGGDDGVVGVGVGVAAAHGGALYYLALLHREGDPLMGIEASGESFARHLDLACDAGYADALFCRADLHYHGTDGAVLDHTEAHAYYLRAAAADHADAMCCLGTMSYLGQGGQPVNHEAAFSWYQRAADTGDEDGGPHRGAWGNLASMYALGHGVPKCMKTAKHILNFLDGKATIEK